jgi:hypothetical protein
VNKRSLRALGALEGRVAGLERVLEAGQEHVGYPDDRRADLCRVSPASAAG